MRRTRAMLLALAGTLLGSWAAAGEDELARKAFTDFQAALTAKDAPRLWALLDADSQKAAERAAKAVKAAYAGAGAARKGKMEKGLGLPGATLATLNGEGFLKTKGFL